MNGPRGLSQWHYQHQMWHLDILQKVTTGWESEGCCTSSEGALGLTPPPTRSLRDGAESGPHTNTHDKRGKKISK